MGMLSTVAWLVAADFVVLVASMDVLMYVLHRLAHTKFFYEWAHRAHHRYQNPKPLTLFVMHPFETLAFGALFAGLLCLYSPTWAGLATYAVINLGSGLAGHLGAGKTGDSLFGFLSTGAFHDRHHRDPDRNFGFYTVVWDRMFRTVDRSG